jgi:phosphatidylserine/phosphatidylglycerophosphate/cardiolipin synthase-like enzyme
MKRWWIILYFCVLTQIPASIWAQTLPEMQPDTSGVALTGPSTPPPLDASEDEHNTNEFPTGAGVKLGRLTVLPDYGRELYFSAIDAATDRIRIEICVLEDPQILQHLQAALSRGVRVRVIVDRGKYSALSFSVCLRIRVNLRPSAVRLCFLAFIRGWF